MLSKKRIKQIVLSPRYDYKVEKDLIRAFGGNFETAVEVLEFENQQAINRFTQRMQKELKRIEDLTK